MVIVHRPSNASEHSSDGFNLNANTVEIADSLSDVIHARLLVVGGRNVGKTSLLTNFLGRDITTREKSSYLSEYTNVRAIGLKTLKKGVVEKATLQVQDTQNLELFPQYARDADIIFYVYDLTREESLTEIQMIKSEVEGILNETAIEVLVASKYDMSPAFDPLDNSPIIRVTKDKLQYLIENSSDVFIDDLHIFDIIHSFYSTTQWFAWTPKEVSKWIGKLGPAEGRSRFETLRQNLAQIRADGLFLANLKAEDLSDYGLTNLHDQNFFFAELDRLRLTSPEIQQTAAKLFHEGMALAELWGISFDAVSARTSFGVKRAFTNAASEWHDGCVTGRTIREKKIDASTGTNKCVTCTII